MVFDALFNQQQQTSQATSPYSKLLEDPRFALGYGLLTSRENPLGAAVQVMGQGEQLRANREDRELKRRRIAMGVDNPAAIREYEYYSKLSPEEQARYLGVKRAQQTLNLGGTQAVLDPVQGGIREKFAVTPKPEQMPDFKGKQAFSAQSGKQAAELQGESNKRTQKATDILPIIAEAKKLLPNATSSGLATEIRDVKQYFGYSGKEAETDARLKLISAALTSSVPRFEGPQGVLDVQIYKEAAADVGNSRLDAKVRLAALETMEQLQRKYAGQPSSIGAQNPQPTAPQGGGQATGKIRVFNPQTGRLE